MSFCRHTIITWLSASLIKLQIDIKEEQKCGWDRIRLADSLCAVSCLMFGYMHRDESYTSNILGMRSGGSGEEVGDGMEEEGELPSQKAWKVGCAPCTSESNQNWTQGSFLKSVPGNLHTQRGSTSRALHLWYKHQAWFCFITCSTTNILTALSSAFVYTFGRFMTHCLLRPKQSYIKLQSCKRLVV